MFLKSEIEFGITTSKILIFLNHISQPYWFHSMYAKKKKKKKSE